MSRVVVRLISTLLPGCALTIALVLWVAPTVMPGWELLYAWREGQMQSWTVQRMDIDRGIRVDYMRGFLFWEALRYSPDRRLIAGYVEVDQLAIFNPSRSGEGIRRIGRGLAPTWSPDGRDLAYQSDGAIYVRGIADGEPGDAVRVSDESADIAFSPRWSPDGTWLAYETESYTSVFREAAEIYIVRRDGSDLQQLTDGYIDPASNPVWSPDGRQLVFTTFDGSFTTFYLFDLASGEGQQLTRHGAYVRGLIWSSPANDNALLAFFSVTQDDIAVYGLSLTGSHDPYRVSETVPDLRVEMMWSPDGERLAFVGIHDGEIYIVAVDGLSPALRLTDSPHRHVLLP